MLWGILMFICGLLSISLPLASSIGIVIVLAWLILFAAICHLIFAFQPHGVGGFLWQVLLAIVYGIAGFYMLMNPLLGVLSLTLVLAGISSLRGNLGDRFLLSYPPGSARRLGFVRRYRYADSRDFNLGPMDHRVPSG